MYISIGFVILTIFYLLYIQFSPGMGNIWYRNNQYYCFMGAWEVMIFPLQNSAMWNVSMWDINYFVWMIVLFPIVHESLIELSYSYYHFLQMYYLNKSHQFQ